MEYNYFVSYWFTNNNDVSGVGRCSITRDAPIHGMADIEAIEAAISKQDGTRVTILNWQPFDEPVGWKFRAIAANPGFLRRGER